MTSSVDIGSILKKVMDDHGLTQQEFADRLRVGRITVAALANNRTGISPNMALRLAKLLGGDPEYWMALQAMRDLAKVRRRLGVELMLIKPLEREG